MSSSFINPFNPTSPAGAGGSVDPSTIDHTLIQNIGTNSHAQIDTHIADTSNPHSVTAAQVGNGTAQWNANQLQGVNLSTDVPTAGQVLGYNDVTSEWEAADITGADATAIQGNDVEAGTPVDGALLMFDTATSTWLHTESLSGDYEFSDSVEFTGTTTGINHTALDNIGTNTHAQIDSHIANTSNPHSVTAAQVGNGTAQWNANQLQGVNIQAVAPSNGQVLQYVSGNSRYEPTTLASGGGGLANYIQLWDVNIPHSSKWTPTVHYDKTTMWDGWNNNIVIPTTGVYKLMITMDAAAGSLLANLQIRNDTTVLITFEDMRNANGQSSGDWLVGKPYFYFISLTAADAVNVFINSGLGSDLDNVTFILEGPV